MKNHFRGEAAASLGTLATSELMIGVDAGWCWLMLANTGSRGWASGVWRFGRIFKFDARSGARSHWKSVEMDSGRCNCFRTHQIRKPWGANGGLGGSRPLQDRKK